MGVHLSGSLALQAAGNMQKPADTNAALSRLRQALAAQSAAQPRDRQLDQLLQATGKLMQLQLHGQQAARQEAHQLLQQLEALVSGWQQLGTQWPLVRRLVAGTMLQQGLLPSSIHSSRSGNASDETASTGQLQGVVDRLVQALLASHVRAASTKSRMHFMRVSKSAGERAVDRCCSHAISLSARGALVRFDRQP